MVNVKCVEFKYKGKVLNRAWYDASDRHPMLPRFLNAMNAYYSIMGPLEAQPDASPDYQKKVLPAVCTYRPPAAQISPQNMYMPGNKPGEWTRIHIRTSPSDTIAPDSAIYHCDLGNQHVKAGQFNDAAVEYMRAVRKFPKYYEAYCNLGMSYEKMEMFEEAINAFKATHNLHPDDTEVVLEISRSYAKLFEYRFKEGYKTLSDLYFNMMHLIELSKAADKSTTPSTLSELHYDIGAAYASLGDQVNSKKEFIRAAKLWPSNAKARLECESLYFNLGAGYLEKGNYVNALLAFKEVLAYNLYHAEAHAQLNLIYKISADYKAAHRA